MPTCFVEKLHERGWPGPVWAGPSNLLSERARHELDEAYDKLRQAREAAEQLPRGSFDANIHRRIYKALAKTARLMGDRRGEREWEEAWKERFPYDSYFADPA